MEETKLYKCDKCHYETNIMSSYKKHLESILHKTGKRKIRSDKKQDSYNCDKCDYKSTNEYNYKTHKLNKHLSKDERKKQFKYYCDKCDFGNFSKICYDIHMKTLKHKIKTN